MEGTDEQESQPKMIRAGRIKVSAESWSDFWKNMGSYLVPYHIEFDQLMSVYTVTATSELFKEAVEGAEIMFYTPVFKKLGKGIVVLDGVTS